MTLTSSTTRAQYSGDGATVSFAISFVTWTTDDTEVILTDSSGVETVWTRGTQYNISLTSPPATSTLTVVTVPTDYTPASGETLTITSKIPNTQETALPLGGSLPSGSVEGMVDKSVRQIQQDVGTFDRAMLVPAGETLVSMALPAIPSRASKYLGFDSLGLPIAVVGTATDADVSTKTVLATGSTTARSLANRFADVINVKDYGAVGDGVTDDTAALNLAFDAMRAAIKTGYSPDNLLPVQLVISPGVYRVDGSVNATMLDEHGWSISAYGAVLVGHGAGKAVFDLLGSRFGSVRGLTVYGDGTDSPKFGIQHGRYGSAPADLVKFYDVDVNGTFTSGALYNYSGETVGHFACRYTNDHNSLSSYAIIQDGTNDFGLASDYVTVTAAAGEAHSFNENSFLTCDIRKRVSGPAIYLRRTARHEFRRCYGVSVDDVVVELNSDSAFGQEDLYLDIHCEAATGLLACVRFDGDATHTIKGFTFIDHSPQAKDEIFLSVAGVTTTTIVGFDCRIPNLQTIPANKLFNDKNKFKVYGGTIFIRDASILTNFADHTGIIITDNRADGVYAPGTQLIFDETNQDVAVKGELRFYDNKTTAGIGSDFSPSSVDTCHIGDGYIGIADGKATPGTEVGLAKIYVDAADGDLKVLFGDGTVKTIVVDT